MKGKEKSEPDVGRAAGICAAGRKRTEAAR